MDEERHNLRLWAVVAALVLAGVLAVAIIGYVRSRDRVADMIEEPAAGRMSEGVETRSVSLFFGNADGDGLIRETREIIAGGGVGEEVKRVVEALARGPLLAGIPTLPPETRLESAFLDSEGRLYLNFGRELRAFHWGGTAGEHQTIRSVILTLAADFPDILSVEFLEEGRPIESLGGHLDISRPLWVDDWR